MLHRSLLTSFVLVLAFGGLALTKPAPTITRNGDSQRVEDLIKQLGSTKFQERNAAQKELEAIGAPALEKLKKAVQTEDLETSKRAAELVRKMEERILTASLLSPKRVHLKLADVAVSDAVKELAKLSGYPVLLQGDLTKVAGKKITLDTGDVTFWEALDQLCAKAGLVEQTTAAATGVNPNLPRIQPVPIQIKPAIKLKAIKPKALPAPAPEVEPAPKEQANDAVPQAFAVAQEAEPADPKVKPAQARAQAQAQAQAQVQVQAQPVQIQVQPLPAQIQPGGFIAPGGRAVPGNPGVIVLVPGDPKTPLVSYAGAVRVRVVPNTIKRAGEHSILLDVAAEPRLQGFNVVGTPTIDRAVDDQGQTLTLAMDAPAQQPANPNIGLQPAMDIAFPIRNLGGNRQALMRLKAGEKEAKTLRELKGSLTAQVLTPPEALITLGNVLKAAGETAKGKDGGALQLNSIEKMANGDYKLQVRMETPPGQNALGGAVFGNGVVQFQQIQIQIGGNGGVIAGAPAIFNAGPSMPELVDAKGNKYQLVQVPARRMNFNNGVQSQELTLVFRAGNGHGDPASLVVSGSRLTTVTVPFAFQNVPVK